MRIICDKQQQSLDRIRAAKEIRAWAGDIFKWHSLTLAQANGDSLPEAPKQQERPPSALAGLKVVG